jgi:hypothetical protein
MLLQKDGALAAAGPRLAVLGRGRQVPLQLHQYRPARIRSQPHRRAQKKQKGPLRGLLHPRVLVVVVGPVLILLSRGQR